MNIFFYEAFEEEAQELERRMPGSISAEFTWKTIQECGHQNPPAPIISTRTQSVLPVEWADQLSGILSRSTGYNHLLSYHAKCQKAVPCGYLPLYCNRSVAEQAMLLWMSLFRKLPLQREQFAGFKRDGLTGIECFGKKLLVVGVGNIGFEIVRIGQGLGMEVKGVDLIQKHESVAYVSIEQGLPWADVIVCAMNLTLQNTGYFNYDLLKKTRPGLVFVNIARGEMSPSSDLLRLLTERHPGGVALDVFHEESTLATALREGGSDSGKEVQATLEMAGFSNVILTPHNAFNTKESVIRKVDHTVQQINHFIQNGQFLWPIPKE